ncbi:MAG: BrnA antitoxin family protein [Acidobacteriota bacterium]
MSVKSTKPRSPRSSRPVRGRADLPRLRRMSERQIQATSPRELADLPSDFWATASVVEPVAKQPISLRVDSDVLDWFKSQGPRYQSRINAVLRSYMVQRRQDAKQRAG